MGSTTLTRPAYRSLTPRRWTGSGRCGSRPPGRHSGRGPKLLHRPAPDRPLRIRRPPACHPAGRDRPPRHPRSRDRRRRPPGRALASGSGEVMALVDVLDEAGVDGLPAHQLLSACGRIRLPVPSFRLIGTDIRPAPVAMMKGRAGGRIAEETVQISTDIADGWQTMQITGAEPDQRAALEELGHPADVVHRYPPGTRYFERAVANLRQGLDEMVRQQIEKTTGNWRAASGGGPASATRSGRRHRRIHHRAAGR
jgi:hypothetical protein